MMDLSSIDPVLIEARGQYASVNGEYKSHMSLMQARAQEAVDLIRHALNMEDAEQASAAFAEAARLATVLDGMALEASDLRRLKSELWPKAWGK
jgi:hypothetical protein